MGPWARAFLDRCRTPLPSDTSSVTDLRVEPSLVTARVDGETVTLSAPPIPAGIWAAIEPVRTDIQSETLSQTLDHTWEESLIPETFVRVGSPGALAAVAAAVAAEIDRDPAVLLRWRGYPAVTAKDGDDWRGADLPELPPAARRPPDSVPKRFGSSGIQVGGDDLVAALVRVYEAF